VTSRRARVALAALAVVALLVGALLFSLARSEPPALPERPPGERPELMLLTTLPIMFGERLTLDAPASPALEALQSRYRVVPISVTAASELRQRRLLLMAQPQAQPAEALVELDAWVREGGRVLLLADPALEWPSERPLGDLLRPPTQFADTGLLAHWGLRLDESGKLVAANQTCATAKDGLIARCRLGRGQATVVADADFLNVEAGETAKLRLLLDELASLEQ
jgi:hypothetical protein